MVEYIKFDQVKDKKRKDRSDVKEGDILIVEWEPYSWSRNIEGYTGRHYAKVADVTHGDITLILNDGREINDLGGKRNKVMGSAQDYEEVPEWTDIGIGVSSYYNCEKDSL